jgi:hypothetical protein
MKRYIGAAIACACLVFYFGCAPLTPPVQQRPVGATGPVAAVDTAASALEVYLSQRAVQVDTAAVALPYIAVLPFENRSEFRKGIWALGDEMGRFMSQRMQGYSLWTTVPFAAVNEALEGFEGSALELGQKLQADIVVHGVIEDYNLERLSVGDPLLGGYKSYKGTAKMVLRAWRVSDGQALGPLLTLQEPIDRGLGLDLLGKPREQDTQFTNLGQMAFASKEFLETALGQATTLGLDDLIAQLTGVNRPGILAVSGEPGRVLSIHQDEIYINLGSENGVYSGFRFEVYPGPQRQGEVLGRLGVLEVEQVIGNRLSSVRFISGAEKVEAGDLLQVAVPADK